MPSTVNAPKIKKENTIQTTSTPKTSKPLKTYNTNKSIQSNMVAKFLTIFFTTLFLLIITLSTITYLKGYVYIPYILTIDNNFIQLPTTTNETIFVDGNNLYKYEKLYLHIQNNVNDNNYIVRQSDKLQLNLAEGINTIEIQRILDFNIIKFGGNIFKTTINYDTTAPKLLSTPKFTNQGLILEFTEPANIKLFDSNKIFRTDDSYTIVIPRQMLANKTQIKFQVYDKLGNQRLITIKINNKTQSSKNSQTTYTSKELPKSAGILTNLNILSITILASLIGIPILGLYFTNTLVSMFHKNKL